MRGLSYYLELEYTYSQSESCALLTCTSIVMGVHGSCFSLVSTVQYYTDSVEVVGRHCHLCCAESNDCSFIRSTSALCMPVSYSVP